MDGEILFIHDKHGNTEEVSIINILSIAGKPELTLYRSLFWSGLGAYGGSAVGYFIGWPLFPAWGIDDADLRGMHLMAALGAAVGVIWISKWFLKNKTVSLTKAVMSNWTIHRKKYWIKSIVLKL